MNPVRVRAADVRDCAALARLVTQLGYPTDDTAMRRRFSVLSADAEATTLIAECDGEVCGMLGVGLYRVWHRDGPVGHLATVVVDERYRGRGIGASLLESAEAWLREHGVQHVVLTSASRRVEAHRFYLKHGYSLTGQRFAKTF